MSQRSSWFYPTELFTGARASSKIDFSLTRIKCRPTRHRDSWTVYCIIKNACTFLGMISYTHSASMVRKCQELSIDHVHNNPHKWQCCHIEKYFPSENIKNIGIIGLIWQNIGKYREKQKM